MNCGGKLVSLEHPIVMGIINLTSDSFYSGSRYENKTEIFSGIEKMLVEGAQIIDIGGMSSRPGAKIISEEEELLRVVPIVRQVVGHFPEAVFSVDTIRSAVAKAVIEEGAGIINDISAGKFDSAMYATIGRYHVPYVLMHMQNKPENMQENPKYENLLEDILDFFIEEVGKLRAENVKDIIIDPGFGFGKSLQHNYQILKKLHVFKILDLPIMAGLSRKSLIYKVLENQPEDALNGTTALHVFALQQGAKILRAHDVKPAMEVIKLFHQLQIN